MVTIIIINYKQKDFTHKCIRSVYETIKSYPFEVIVVNNSFEDDLSYLEADFENLKVINNINNGFSQANNTGVKYSKGEYLFFLNADTEIKTDFLGKFIEKFKSMNFGAAGLKLSNPDGTFQLSFWKENTFLNEILNKKEEKKFKAKDITFIKNIENKYDEVKKVDWVTGAAFIIKKEVFIKAGEFDDDYFLFYEDADLCKRLTVKGLPVYFYPYCSIIHHKGENVNKNFRSDSYFYSKQSQIFYYGKHNGFGDNFLLRIYLFVKFSILYLFTFKKINLDIVKLTIGIPK